MTPAVATLLLACSAAGHAEPPTQQLVMSRAAILYAGRVAGLSVDGDARYTARVRDIAVPLIAQARRDHPDTALWQWEIHTTDDPDQNADCMAGGKILVSKAYVERLQLGDADLAMLLAHEIEHAALRHNLREYQQALRLEPGWALLAWRAGWPAGRLAGYFKKMVRASYWPNHVKPDYPSPFSRLRAARALADGLQKNPVQAAD